MRKKILIFDLDGVLIDSKINMQLAWKVVQDKHSLSHISFNQYFNHIGRPFNIILKKLKIKKNHELIKKTYEQESKNYREQIKYFKNVIATLKKLKKNNYKLNIVTSKDKTRTKIFLRDYINLFDEIECDDKKTKGKPHPDKINKIINILNVQKKECVYIGDTHIDFMSAKNSKIDFIFAQWGYGKKYNYKYKCKNILKLNSILNIINNT